MVCKIKLNVNNEDLDESIAKANQLVELLREAQHILSSLSGTDKSESYIDESQRKEAAYAPVYFEPLSKEEREIIEGCQSSSKKSSSDSVS